ncbi:MAG: hypothetical protein MUO88_19975 [Desulfobacterales bacterium]|nr:hypothetical protein [Desulfobacterales bacterium]
MKNDFHNILNKFLNQKSIDRKKVSLSETTKYVSTEYEIYTGAEIIIIKNNNGRILFNEYVKFLDYKEKGIGTLKQISYPYYILSLDWITAGCHFGQWEYFQNINDLSKEIDLESMTDNYEDLKNEMLRGFGLLEWYHPIHGSSAKNKIKFENEVLPKLRKAF